MTPPAKERPFDPEFGHEGWFEDRDPQGCDIHWSWLLRHWNDLADKLVAEEERRANARKK